MDFIVCGDDVFKIGEIYKIYYGNVQEDIFQIRAIVDEEWVVIKHDNESYALKHRSWFDAVKKDLEYRINWS